MLLYDAIAYAKGMTVVFYLTRAKNMMYVVICAIASLKAVMFIA